MAFVSPARVRTRSRTPADTEFLAGLYAATRAEEFAALPWPDATRDAFLRSQFDAQTAHYDRQYPDAEFLVIELQGVAIGRLTIWETDAATHIVDIALLPGHRGQGLGAALVRAVLAQSASTSLHVEHHNPALRLYQRLGFVIEEDTGVYYRMRCNSHFAASANGSQS